MDDQPTTPVPEAPGPGDTQVMPEATGPAAPVGGPGRNAVLIAVIVVILLLGSIATVYIWQRGRADDAERRVEELEERLADLEDADSAEDAEPAESEPAPESDPGSSPEEEPEPDDGPAVETEDGRYIGKITDIYNIMQARWIEIDFIQFLTGDDAAAEAAARGDESPPPNDYYIVNDNPRLRDFNVREGLQVKMWTWDIETDGVMEQDIPFDVWWDEIEIHGQARYLSVPYWVIVDNGTVIEIEEQYLP